MADTSISNGTYGTTLPAAAEPQPLGGVCGSGGNVYHQLPVPNSNDDGDATLPGAGCDVVETCSPWTRRQNAAGPLDVGLEGYLNARHHREHPDVDQRRFGA